MKYKDFIFCVKPPLSLIYIYQYLQHLRNLNFLKRDSSNIHTRFCITWILESRLMEPTPNYDRTGWYKATPNNAVSEQKRILCLLKENINYFLMDELTKINENRSFVSIAIDKFNIYLRVRIRQKYSNSDNQSSVSYVSFHMTIPGGEKIYSQCSLAPDPWNGVWGRCIHRFSSSASNAKLHLLVHILPLIVTYIHCQVSSACHRCITLSI